MPGRQIVQEDDADNGRVGAQCALRARIRAADGVRVGAAGATLVVGVVGELAGLAVDARVAHA